MLTRQDEVVRVGVCLVLVSAIVGLIVLLFSGNACAAEQATPRNATDVLMKQAPVSASEHLIEAEELLRVDRTERRNRLWMEVVEQGWRTASSMSPNRLYRGGRKVYKQIRNFRDRSGAEDRALELLEAEVFAGSEDPRLNQLYAELRLREEEAMIDRWFEDVTDAIANRDWNTARRRLDRIIELRPDSARAQSLVAELDSVRLTAESKPDTVPSVSLNVEPWEAALLSGLLLERNDWVIARAPTTSRGTLASAAAHCLAGAPRAALLNLDAVSENQDGSGEVARRLLEDPAINPRAALEREERKFKLRRSLGWVGGENLEQQGLKRSGRAYKVWQRSMQPLNLAMSMPARMIGGWTPDSTQLRDAATQYLEVFPDGARAEDARDYLAELPVIPERGWDDGFFVLPRAQVAYAPVAARPIWVSRAALEVALPHLAGTWAAEYDHIQAVLLDPTELGYGVELSAAESGELIFHLAQGLEDDRLRPHGDSANSAMEHLRTVYLAVLQGRPLRMRIEDDSPEIRAALAYTFATGEATDSRSFRMKRGKDDMNVAWSPGQGACPGESLCIDHQPGLSGSLYASINLSANLVVGARTEIGDARFGIQLGRNGPQASLTLPLASWLGIARWVPLEAHVDLGFDGVSIGPRFKAPKQPGLNPSLKPGF